LLSNPIDFRIIRHGCYFANFAARCALLGFCSKNLQ
jgi:hypothetical protein